MKRALKVLTDREVSPQLGLLKSTLLQLDSTFSERDYGVSTFRDFIEKVAKTGLVTLRHSGRSMMVDAVDTADGAELPPVSLPVSASTDTAPVEAGPSRPPAPAPPAPPRLLRRRLLQLRSIAEQIQQLVASVTRPVQPRHAAAAMADVRAPAQAVSSRDRSELRRAQVGVRHDHGIPSRGQREGLLRLERDRRGQIRVFPGSALAGDSERTGGAARRGKNSRMTCGTSWKPSRSKRCPATSLEPDIEPAESERRRTVAGRDDCNR